MPRARTQRGPRKTVWKLEPHTKAKHELVRRYLGGWFPILGKYSGRVVFLDGFAGPGIYDNGDRGSPIVALDTLLGHPHFERLKCEFVFLFFEPESDRAESLRRELDSFVSRRNAPLPKNVKFDVRQVTFVDGANEIVSTLKEQKKRLAPTFAFIDPFGFSGVPIELIAELLTFDKCEVFFNLMFDHINRFANAGNVNHHLEEIFGTNEYTAAGALPAGSSRRDFLHELYKRQLREAAGFQYVQQFQMFNTQGHNIYSLFFGTRHIAGLRVMKDAMWKVDPGGGSQFSDRLAGQSVLFEEKPNVSPLRHVMVEEFAGQTVPVEFIEEFVLVSTPYAATHYNRLVLAPLEREGLIEVVSSTRKKRCTFPAQTVIRFKGNPEVS